MSEEIRIFIGVDKRQPLAYHVLCQSIMDHTSRPVTFTPLILKTLPIKRRGLTDFTYSRYLVPHLCGYVGKAIFMDADMIVRDDIAKLVDSVDSFCAVNVVKGVHKFEWSSMMVFNNSLCKKLTPEYIESGNPFDFSWAKQVGEIDPKWNHCVGYDKRRDDACLVHYTAGIPAFPETEGCEYSDEWVDVAKKTFSSVSWNELMGNSVHAQLVKSGALQDEKNP